jgi:dTDP-4-dehydrorhamnose reductase
MIFGGSGFVGGNITKIARHKGWSVIIADSFFRSGLEDVRWITADITDPDTVKNAIQTEKPDAVVNVAAIADIDKAEQDKELAWKVNVDGARYIAENCAESGINYVFFSSDAVFDGKSTSYKEEDRIAPVNYYGYTKAEAEKAVLNAYPGAVVIRISLVVGLPVTGGNSFLGGLKKKLEEGAEIICPIDEIRTPVDVLTLSESVLELAESKYSGILHIGATDSINRYELAKKAAILMGLDKSQIKPLLLPENMPDRVPRHKNGILNVDKARQVLKTRMLSVEEGIKRAVTEKLT